MNQTEINNLIQQGNLGAEASAALTFLEDWLEAYQEWIISNLKTCQEDRLVEYRNLLLASEGFKSFLASTIASGQIANKELADFKQQEEYLQRTGYFPGV